MLKNETTGFIGEELFVEFLKENNIPFTDLRTKKVIKKISVNKNRRNKEYSYFGNLTSHPFDFIIGGMNIEIKTSTIHRWDNKVTFSWTKNDRKNIKYVIGIVINKQKKILNFLLFDNNYINSHVAFSIEYNDKLKQIIAKNSLIKLLTAQGIDK